MAAYIDEFYTSAASVCSILFLVLSTFALSLRLYTRVKIVQRVYASDVAIILAWFLSIALTVSVCLEVRYGLGRHVGDVPSENLSAMLKLFWISVFVYNPALAAVKVSLALQYIVFFGSSSVRIPCWITLVVVTTHGFVGFLLSIFACTPVSYFWDKSQSGSCIDLMAFWFFNASLNIVTDLALVLLPLLAVRNLKIPSKQKLSLYGLFVLGGIECIISIIRLHALYNVSTGNPDVTYTNADAATLSSVEVNVGLTCACLATLKPLLVRLKIFDSARRESVANMGNGRHPTMKSPLPAANAEIGLNNRPSYEQAPIAGWGPNPEVERAAALEFSKRYRPGMDDDT